MVNESPSPSTAAPPEPGRHRNRSTAAVLGLDRFSGLYVWAIVIVLFAVLVPDTFFTTDNLRLVANQQAITVMLALALIIPLAAGVFDLSFAATMGMALMLTAYLQSQGVDALLAALVAVLLGTVVGSLNGLVMTRLHIDSFITTLGMSSILAAGTYWISGGFPIQTGISPALIAIGTTQIGGLSIIFFVMVALAIVLYVVMEYTPAAGTSSPSAATRSRPGSRACGSTGSCSRRWWHRERCPPSPASCCSGSSASPRTTSGRPTCCRRSRPRSSGPPRSAPAG
ncbi:hypothetical protein BJF78_23785 [Pseudonocardia sp. CNS-139]|nr:hypothetical protein BJF78_23785 [Pseudonocardia sp. CNS-139]